MLYLHDDCGMPDIFFCKNKFRHNARVHGDKGKQRFMMGSMFLVWTLKDDDDNINWQSHVVSEVNICVTTICRTFHSLWLNTISLYMNLFCFISGYKKNKQKEKNYCTVQQEMKGTKWVERTMGRSQYHMWYDWLMNLCWHMKCKKYAVSKILEINR